MSWLPGGRATVIRSVAWLAATAVVGPASSWGEELSCTVAGAKGETVTLEEGKRIVTTKDGFVTALSPFDRASRLKSDKPIDGPTYLEFVSRQVAPWTPEERARVDKIWCALGTRIAARKWRLSLPPKIQFVKTTGDEEGHALYTRGTSIVIPQTLFAAGEELEASIPHEVFHVYSRHLATTKDGRARQNALYALVGYAPLEHPFKPPASYLDRLITNPDGYDTTHGITVRADGTSHRTVPMLFADPPRYDTTRGGEFFQYLQFKLVPVQREGDAWVAQTHPDGTPVLFEPTGTNYLKLVGRNTQELFQPDEILAANFALAVGDLAGKSVPDPQIVEKLRALLEQ